MIIPAGISAGASGAPSAPAGQVLKGSREERHPEMRAAIRHLEQARESLQKAAHDFHGHRARALELTDQALRECREALESDRR